MNLKKCPGLRLGILFAALSIACGILLYTMPDATRAAFGYLMHSDFSFTIKPFSAINFLAGAGLWFVIGAIVGCAWSFLCGCCKNGK